LDLTDDLDVRLDAAGVTQSHERGANLDSTDQWPAVLPARTMAARATTKPAVWIRTPWPGVAALSATIIPTPCDLLTASPRTLTTLAIRRPPGA